MTAQFALLHQASTNPADYFYIFDPNLEPIGVKQRYHVHRDGDWHRGVQLNIVCGNELLLQRRSHTVDIAWGLFDQSLATQLIISDQNDEVTALRRGLKTELGLNIKPNKFKKLAGPKKIIKTYPYDPTLYNREFVSLYELALAHKPTIQPRSPKVTEVSWLPLPEVKALWHQEPETFTQTFAMWLKEM